jgi:hypothetical protein
MRIAITLLLAIVPWSASAQKGQTDNLDEIIAKLRACVRTHAAEAQAAAAKGVGDTVDYFVRVCSPPIIELDPAKVGAVPPGIFRVTITKEWATITGETRTR